MRAVFPSADSATSLPASFGPCWAHVVSSRVKTHVAPSPTPPISAVLPSAGNATLEPN
jgi:hypothetical protein